MNASFSNTKKRKAKKLENKELVVQNTTEKTVDHKMEEQGNEKNESQTKQINFRDLYIEEMTNCFGEDLDKIREQEANFDSKSVKLLVDCLESGMSTYSTLQKNIFVDSAQRSNAVSVHSLQYQID